MIKENGQDDLRRFSAGFSTLQVTQITPRVWHVLGLGHSNAIFAEGTEHVLLIDTLDTAERGRALREIIWQKTGKRVKTILYTHSHPDHLGGAGAFCEDEPEVIAFTAKTGPLAGTERLKDILALRGVRQFGYQLSDEQAISQGIGIREGHTHGETPSFLSPTLLFSQDIAARRIDGIQVEMRRLVGESEDQAAIFLPEEKVLCCGDNFYGCWPNLYAIRGCQYRDIAAWVRSLDTLLTYPAEYLLPGHTAPVCGRKQVQDTLKNDRDAIDFILTQTLCGMDEGKTIDQLATEIRLPEKWASLPYLGEYYGCVEWTVRAIYTAYLGWFDGDPTHLHPLPPKTKAEKTVALMGGEEAVRDAAQKALRDKEPQWCLELCDLLFALGKSDDQLLRQKAAALEAMAERETSANGRHYYLACAQELCQKANQENQPV